MRDSISAAPRKKEKRPCQTTSHPNSFQGRGHADLRLADRELLFKLSALEGEGVQLSRLPFSLRILFENLLRCEDGKTVTAEDIKFLASVGPEGRAFDARLPTCPRAC